MNFIDAMMHAWMGHKVRRKDWTDRYITFSTTYQQNTRYVLCLCIRDDVADYSPPLAHLQATDWEIME